MNLGEYAMFCEVSNPFPMRFDRSVKFPVVAQQS